MEDVKDQGDEELYAKLDAAYSSDEEDMEVGVTNFYYGHACSIELISSVPR
jgi:hypothetical protein